MKFRVSKLMVAAVLLWLAYAGSVSLGLQDWVGLLSGTPVPGVDLEVAALGASVHVLSWFGAVIVAPVLVIAAALLEFARRDGLPGGLRSPRAARGRS